MAAVCVAVISKENQPLFLRTAKDDPELQFHYYVHTSLDVIDEKVGAPPGRANEQREMYLGILYPTEDYKIYGYVTNTKVKFIVIVDNTNSMNKDSEIKQVFRTLHTAYCENLLNPFYAPGESIVSRTFNKTIDSLLQPS
ncbi:trafficking protein particle complex subunit 2-like protein [Sycon ciliatum]|uniref:trafficking protein particle complex subunit 2-like protein n=1 Tax=Sycon ciliatum TaxID=27933 RepID=UPI0031F6DA44|eukprot:scpid22579/ scgid7859/ Trafficking protein particle complex subunit 2-like protein